MKKEQFEKITKWQYETFGQATATSKLNHLEEEVDELKSAIDFSYTEQSIGEEFADCFILLFGAAASQGYTYEAICEIIDKKMEINYARKWGKPNENGVVNHIR